MESQVEYETILDFGRLGKENALDDDVPIERIPNTYIPKSEHNARLKFYRLENIRSNVGRYFVVS